MSASVTHINYRQAENMAHTREHAEWLTRQAARAIGLDVSNAAWSVAHGGLLIVGDGVSSAANRFRSFAPLNDMADAFQVESKLRMNAHYRFLNEKQHAIYMSLAHDKAKCDLWAIINDGDDVFRVRMNAVVQLAALRQVEIDNETGR
jgi:hypothetical protein